MSSLTRSALDRAKALLVDPAPENVRYAALELRMVMEALTYDKLSAASDQLPPSVVNTWQAPQALKALLEFQELADQSFSVSVAELADDAAPTSRQALDSLNWLPLGDHHALSLSWLRKNYNKVGNMLHSQPPGNNRVIDFAKMSADLQTVVAELERAIGSTIITLAERGGLVFNCVSCKKPIVRNHEALKRGETAVCPTAGCDAEYRLIPDTADQTTVSPILVSFECTGCNGLIELHHRKVKVSNRFSCLSCGTRHVISGLQQRWQYAVLPGDGASPAPKDGSLPRAT